MWVKECEKTSLANQLVVVLGLSVCDLLNNTPLPIKVGLYWLVVHSPTTCQSHDSLTVSCVLAAHSASVWMSISVCWWNEREGAGCVFLLWAGLKMLTTLKIISQEGCLCETEVQEESCWNTRRSIQGVCGASCLGPRPCVRAKKSTAFHFFTHSAVSTLVSQNRKEPRGKVFCFFNLLFPSISHNLKNVFHTKCPTIFPVCVCKHSSCHLVLCQHQTRRSWKHLLIFCYLLPTSLFFSIMAPKRKLH